MTICDLCGQEKRCSPKEIEGREFDICASCWKPIAMKLKGKGRRVRERETVFLPPVPDPRTVAEPGVPKPLPGEPPKIWSGLSRFEAARLRPER